MNLIYLKFLLQDGHFLVVTLPEDQARSIIERFKDGTYSPEHKGTLSGVCTQTGAHWVLLISRVVGVHTFRPEDVQQPPKQQQPPYIPPQRFSGRG